ncbi:MAG: FixH family protein [Alphaproteobacteria bacterium]
MSDMTAHDNGFRLTGPRVFLMLCGFFGLMLIANGMLVYQAATTWTGLEAPKSTVHGMKWNDELARAEAQAARGWQVSAELFAFDETPHVSARFMDRDGLPAAVSSLDIRLKRPVDADFDQSLSGVALGGGAWRADLTAPLATGQWDLEMVAKGADGSILHQSIDRVFLK